MTEAQDARADARAGIREGSARDTRMDRARGLPPDTTVRRTTTRRRK